MSCKQYYITPDDLADQLEISQQQGAPTARLCEMFREMATRILGKSAYRGYDRSTKEDLVSEALLKCIKAVKNYKPERRASCFAYYTRAIETSNFDQLEKHYRQINIKRALTEKAAQSVADYNPIGAQQILNNIDHNGITEE